MIVRSLDVLDLPLLSRYRRDMLSLDSARILTRGNPLGAVALLSYLDPRHHIYTAVASENGISLMGQVTLREEETSARVTFLAPAEDINGLTQPLLDHLVTQAGEWGAFHLLAEVDEDSPAFRLLRQAGFAMYAWQRIWKLPVADPDKMKKDIWRHGSRDGLAGRPVAVWTDRPGFASPGGSFAEAGHGSGLPPGGEPAGLCGSEQRAKRHLDPADRSTRF